MTSILIGLIVNNTNPEEMEYSLSELKNLAKACDMEVVATSIQHLDKVVSATYIGSGKAEEIAEYCENNEVDCVIFEDTLSPAQLKNLSKIIKVKIYDRTSLILEIFSKRAKTREARLQVESANLQYTLPRLIGMWEAIGRQGGASGSKSSKGIGETQLELDRRWIQKRLAELRRELEKIEHDRATQRVRREKSNLPLVSLVGYTNAGKSTIMNRLLNISLRDEEKQVFEKDMLFATLDTQVRRIETGDKKDFLLSDTVGFVNKLPHSLIKAFRSTLDEIRYADLLVEVVDYSDEHVKEQMQITMDTLRELGALEIPIIHVMNKADLADNDIPYPRIMGDKIYISAANNQGIDELISLIKDRVYARNCIVDFLVPYCEGKIVNDINENARILETKYQEDGTLIKADAPAHIIGRYNSYIISKE